MSDPLTPVPATKESVVEERDLERLLDGAIGVFALSITITVSQ